MNTKRAYWLRAALIALIGVLSFAQANAGGKGIDVRISPSYEPNSLYVEWVVYGETQPVKFELFQADGYRNDPDDLNLYVELTPDSTMEYDQGGKSLTAYLDLISYGDSSNATFYVKATYADSTVKTSELFYLGPNIEPEPIYIAFTSLPKTTAKYGELYEYHVNAEASNGAEITYSLVDAPAGATIDSETGLISWTPNERGRFQIAVYAALADDAFNSCGQYQYWTLLVPQCDSLSKITGEVKDQDGNPVEHGYIELVAETDSLGYGLIIGGCEIENGEYAIKDLDQGSYYLVAYFKDQYGREPRRIPVTVGCDEHKIVNIEITAPDLNNQITITSIPENHLKLGQTYTYDVDASAPNANLEIHYRLLESPFGASINEATGVITWTPASPGSQMFTVEAWAEENEGVCMLNSYQGWQVQVTDCDDLATINLAVNYGDEDKPLAQGHAYLFHTVPADSSMYLLILADAPVENGVATFENVDKGSYYLMVDDFHDEGRNDYFYQHWYENATSYENATPIVVNCGQQLSLTMTLVAPPAPNYYTVSGVVTNSEGDPVENAMVELYSNSYGYTGYYPHYYQVLTDADGRYEISAADDAEYMAVAYILPDSSESGSFYFLPVYYNQTTDPSEAELITLTGDRTDINFVLPSAPNFNNSVTGTITDENDMPLSESFVMLYLVEPAEGYDDWLYYGFVSTTKSDGTYEATSLMPGQYVAFAFSPKRDHFVPGYYKEGAPSTMNWEDATLIEVGDSTHTTDINIKLGMPKGLIGIGRVDGKVFGDEKKQIVKGSGELPSDKPIAGANVYAVNEQGKVAGSAQTETDGSFVITGLSKGTYSLSIDKVGYELSNVNVTLSDDNSKSNADISIRNKSVNDNLELAIAKVAPNPAAETLTLNFQADGQTRITLVNSLGSKVYSANLGSLRGVSTHEINLGSYPQGSYYAIIESGLRSSTIPVIIVK